MSRPTIDSLILQPGRRKRCEFVEAPTLMPGWVCCQCSTYNGIWRRNCKTREHGRCKRLYRLRKEVERPKDRFYAARIRHTCVCGEPIEVGDPMYYEHGEANCDKHGFEAATRKAQGQ